MSPPSQTALPATLCPPPLTESGRSCSRAKWTARRTSRRRRAGDQRRAAVDHGVEDATGIVVPRIISGKEVTAGVVRGRSDGRFADRRVRNDAVAMGGTLSARGGVRTVDCREDP